MNERLANTLTNALDHYEYELEDYLDVCPLSEDEEKSIKRDIYDLKYAREFVNKVIDARYQFNESLMFD